MREPHIWKSWERCYTSLIDKPALKDANFWRASWIFGGGKQRAEWTLGHQGHSPEIKCGDYTGGIKSQERETREEKGGKVIFYFAYLLSPSTPTSLLCERDCFVYHTRRSGRLFLAGVGEKGSGLQEAAAAACLAGLFGGKGLKSEGCERRLGGAGWEQKPEPMLPSLILSLLSVLAEGASLQPIRMSHLGVCPNQLNPNLWVDAQSTCERECHTDQVSASL